MLEAYYEVDRIVAYFSGRSFGLEIKRAEATRATARGVEFRIEIENAFRFLIDQAQVRIPGALHVPIGRAREIATESRRGIEHLVHRVFEMAAHLVNPRDALDHASRRVQAPNDFIEHGRDLPNDALIRCILRIDRDDLFSRSIKDHFAERDPAQLPLLLEEPRNERVNRGGQAAVISAR